MTTTDPQVALNAHLLVDDASYRAAGIAVYITNLLRHITTVDTEMRYCALLGHSALLENIRGLAVTRSRIDTRRPQVRILWEQLVMPVLLRHLGVDLLHALAFVGPLISPCPQVVTVHDLSFLRHPEFFRRGNRSYLRMMTKISCRKAAAVIAVSDFTAREAAALLGVSPSRIHTVYHGVKPSFRPLPQEDIIQFRGEMGLPERFILHVGTLEPRKNLLRLVRAFARLQIPDVHLVLAGGRGWLYEALFAEVEHLDLVDRVHFPGYVDAKKLTLWYNAAEVFSYVSNYEGFGLPVLEALACGVPTLTSNMSSLPEAAGDGALLVSPNDDLAIADGLRRLLSDVTLRASLRQRGLAHAAQFTWERAAGQTAEVYRRVMSVML